MPALAKKKVTKTPGGAGKLPDIKVEEREVIYPQLTVNGVLIPEEKMRVSADVMKKLLFWETEEDYKVRCEKSSDIHERAKGMVGFGDEYLLLDTVGRKVRCWNDLDNREWKPNVSGKYEQDILNRQWAGPSIFPGETVNGETIIIGRTGKVESGQHRGIGLILAVERWKANPKAYPQWTEEPYIESLVVFGVSENPIIVRTLDNVAPRTLGDVIHTSDIFKYKTEGGVTKPTNQKERSEMSRMLDAAIDTLWRRTDAGGDNEPTRRFQTHSTSFDFLGRHEQLKRCVKYIYETNAPDAGRKLVPLRLSPGQTAACLYLMASSTSDPDEYLKDRDEKRLKWDHQDKAEEFFEALTQVSIEDGEVQGGDRSFQVVVETLIGLVDVAQGELGLFGRMEEKIAVLAAGWKVFLKDEEITDDDLVLSYGKDKNDNTVILDPPTFGGIDMGHDPSPPERVSPKQAEAAKKKLDAKKAGDALKATGKGKKTQGGSALEIIGKLKELHPEHLLLFRDEVGDYKAYGADAETMGKEMVMEVTKGPGNVPLVNLPASAYEATVKQMMAANHKLKTVAWTDGEATVTEVQARKVGPRPGTQGKPPAKAPVQANGAATQPNGQEAAKPKPKAGPKPGAKKPVLRGGTN